MDKTIYDISVEKPNGELQSLEDYKGKLLLVVNTASKCGFTDQFEELQQLYDQYKDKGLVVLGFPTDNFRDQEFADINETMSFCKINYGVSFPMFQKVDVVGEQVDPLFKFLTSAKKGLLTGGVKWNFTKFLINQNGQVVERLAPQSSSLKLAKSIEELLSE